MLQCREKKYCHQDYLEWLVVSIWYAHKKKNQGQSESCHFFTSHHRCYFFFSCFVLSRKIFFSNLFLLIPTSQLFIQIDILILPIYYVSKIIMTFHCLKQLICWISIQTGISKVVLNNYNVFFFLTEGLNNFWNKILLLLYRKELTRFSVYIHFLTIVQNGLGQWIMLDWTNTKLTSLFIFLGFLSCSPMWLTYCLSALQSVHQSEYWPTKLE